MMEKYEPLGVIGEGSYGIVLKCRCKENGKTVAIKKFIDTEDDQNVKKIAQREIRVLRKLRHENLVSLIEVFRRRKHLYLVFEFIDHTLLDQLEQKSKGLDPDVCRKYIFQILRGLGFCHDNKIIHRDIKPENVLVSKNGVVKLCDFGFARNLCGPGDIYTDYVATRWYRAPELLVGDAAYGKEVDIWAVGCLFAEMMTGEPLFPGDSDIDQLFLIAQCLGRLSKRHLSLMSRNSAFRGFKYPASRNGSTNSTSSTTTTFSKSKGTSAEQGHRYSGGQQKGRNGRTNSVSKSVFAVMFPSWTEEAVQFLTLCLDPEPAGRPTCSAAMRLPYFTHDGFPARFTTELRTKLQMDGYPLNPAYSTALRKKPLINTSIANVTQTNKSSPTQHFEKKATFLTHLLQPQKKTNPMYQSRMNLSTLNSQDIDEPDSECKHEVDHKTNNSEVNEPRTIHFDPSLTIINPSPVNNGCNSISQQQRFSIAREQTFLVKDKPPISFSNNAYKLAGNNLSRKPSNESIASTNSIAVSTTEECSSVGECNNTKKRFSFHSPPKKLSFSDSIEDASESRANTSGSRGILPVTTLTFSLGPTGNPFHNPNSNQAGSINTTFSFSSAATAYNLVKSPTYPTSRQNSQFSPNHSGGNKKRLSTNNLAPLNSNLSSQLKSLPVSVFGSSISGKKENAEPFLPKMNASKMFHFEEGYSHSGGLGKLGSPTKPRTIIANAFTGNKKEKPALSKWDTQVFVINQGNKRFSEISGVFSRP